MGKISPFKMYKLAQMTYLILFVFDWRTNKQQKRLTKSISSYYMNRTVPVLPTPNNPRCDYSTLLLFFLNLQCKTLQSKHTVNKINKDGVLQKTITRAVSYTEISEPLEMSVI